jgi:hypothetical protein
VTSFAVSRATAASAGSDAAPLILSPATDLLRAGFTRRSHPSALATRASRSRWIPTGHAMLGLQEDAAQRIDAALRNALTGT